MAFQRLLLAALVLSPNVCANDESRISAAKAVVKESFAGKFDEGIRKFDATMTRSRPVPALRKIHTDLSGQYGKLKIAEETTT